MLRLEKKLFTIFLFVSFVLFFLSFVNFNSVIKKNKNRLNILVTNGAIYDFVKNIGGDKINLLKLTFLNKEGHMHNVELMPQDIITLNSADLVFKIGYGIDDWIDKYLVNTTKTVYKLDDGVNLIKDKNNINPHYWLSIKNAKIIVKNINKILKINDPNNSFYYDKKTFDYLNKLNELEDYALNKLNPLINKEVIITHPAFDYLFNDYGIKVVAVIYSDELKEMSAREILDLSKKIKEEKIEVIFVEKGLVTNFTKQISDLFNLKMFFLNPIEVINDSESYYNLMIENINTIKKALQ
ncbi:MAG: metal ABC transporter substrate-binding protein [Candidatus Parcubacteria bacterium]|nr:MAG: metal ABC transporter substrate-binding protein [Candidatus Parcubacteria bacterium]